MLLELWTSTMCRLVRLASGCWSSTPAFGAPLFWGMLPFQLWPRSAWTLLWALFRELGRGRPLTDRSRSTISSTVHSWTAAGVSRVRAQGQRTWVWGGGKGMATAVRHRVGERPRTGALPQRSKTPLSVR